jgi:hypothetical protein
VQRTGAEAVDAARPLQAAARPRQAAARQRRVGDVALFGQRRRRLRRARRRGGRACAGRRKNEEDKWRLVGLEGASMRGARA